MAILTQEGIEWVIKATDLSGDVVKQVIRNLDEFESRNKTVSEKISAHWNQFRENWFAVSAAIASTIYSIHQAWEMGRRAADLEETRGILDNLAQKYRTTADDIIGSMKKASHGLIANSDLMQVALAGLAKGLEPEQMINLSKAATLLGDTVGKEATTALNELATALETGKVKGLANYLGTIDLSESFGDLASKLSDADRAHALYLLTMIQYEELLAQQTQGISAAADEFELIDVKIKNARESIDQFFLTIDKGIMLSINALMSLGNQIGILAADAMGFVEKMIQRARESIDQFFLTINKGVMLSINALTSLGNQIGILAANAMGFVEKMINAGIDYIDPGYVMGPIPAEPIPPPSPLPAVVEPVPATTPVLPPPSPLPAGVISGKSPEQEAYEREIKALKEKLALQEVEKKNQTDKIKGLESIKTLNEQIEAQISRMILSEREEVDLQAQKWLDQGADQVKVAEWVAAKKHEILLKEEEEATKISDEHTEKTLRQLEEEIEANERAYQLYIQNLEEIIAAEERILDLKKQQTAEIWNSMMATTNLIGGEAGKYLGLGQVGLMGVAGSEDELAEQQQALNDAYGAQLEALMQKESSEAAIQQSISDYQRQSEALRFAASIKAYRNYANIAMGIMGTILTFTGKNSQAMFYIEQAYALAMAIMNTAQGVTAALALGPKGIPLAAIIAALGAVQIAVIAAQTLAGPASSPSNKAYSGSGYSYTPEEETTWTPTTTTAEKAAPVVNIIIMGNVYDQDELARELIPSITKALEDGAH